MNILFLTTDYKPSVSEGGIAEYSHKVAKNFSGHGCNVIMLAPKCKGDKDFDRRQTFITYRLPDIRSRFLRNILYFFCTIYVAKKHNPDVAFSGTFNPCGIISILLSRVLQFTTVLAIHGNEVLYSNHTFRQKIKSRLRFIQVRLLDKATRIFAVSHYTQENLIKLGIAPSKILVFNNGVDLEDFISSEKHNIIINRLNLHAKKVILTVSRLEKRKGHDIVIKALPKVLQQVPNVVYLIAGTGEYGPYLEKLVADIGLKKHVCCLGHIPNTEIAMLYNTCDVFIMASRIVGTSVEGFGIVFLEANACKKPTIGGASGGIPDAIVQGETGLIVNPENPDAIASALIKLLSNEELAREMGEKGYERIRCELNWDRITSKMLKVMENGI